MYCPLFGKLESACYITEKFHLKCISGIQNFRCKNVREKIKKGTSILNSGLESSLKYFDKGKFSMFAIRKFFAEHILSFMKLKIKKLLLFF